MGSARWLVSGVVVALAASCVLDREGQRQTVAPPVGGAGGMEVVACTTVADCPDEVCSIESCMDGLCRSVPEATNTPCGDGRVCDVASVCKKPAGESCDEAAECHTGFCADAVCCDEECVGLCASCVVTDVGQCTVVPAGRDPDDDCRDDAVCGGERACAFGSHVWSTDFGTTFNAVARAITVDPGGNVIFAIQFTGTLSIGTEMYVADVTYPDVAIVKLDADGTLVWSRHISGLFSERVHSLTADSAGNIVVAGDFFSTIVIDADTLDAGADYDGFVFMLDADGAVRWSKQFAGTTDSVANAVAVGPDGSVVVVGSFSGPHDIEGTVHQPTILGDSEIWAAKFSVAGTHVWSRVLPSAGNDYGLAVDVAADGTVLLGGDFNGTLDSVVGSTTADATDVFVVTLNTNGEPTATHTWSGSGNQRLTGLTALPDGFAISGTFDSFADFGGGPLLFVDPLDTFVAIFDGDGEHVWSQSYAGSNQQRVESIDADENGNVVIAGTFNGDITFEGVVLPNVAFEDPFIAKLSPTGKLIWKHGWGADEYERLEATATGPDNSVVALGEFGTTTINLGGMDLVNSGLYDEVFVVKLTP